MGEQFVRFEAVPKSTPLEKALEKINLELANSIKCNHLIVIDKYFLKVEDAQAEHYSKTFSKWMLKNELQSLTVYSEGQGGQFKDFIIRKCSEKITCYFEDLRENIHDRYWVFTPDYCNYQIAHVGTSLNGFGKGYSNIIRMSESDAAEFLKSFNFIVKRGTKE